MAVCYVRRRMLLLILSTTCFLTIGFRTLSSFERSQNEITSEKANEELLYRKERKLPMLNRVTNNANKARQLSSYNNSNKRGKGANARDRHPQQTIEKVLKKNEQPNDIETDDKPFTDCESAGHVDMSAYPLVDARTVFCGENVWDKRSSTGDELFRAPGALSPHLVGIMIAEKNSETDHEGKIPEMYVFGQTGEYPMRLSEVIVGSVSSLISVRSVSVIGRGRRVSKSRREVKIGDKTHDVGQLLFFPPILSHQKTLMKFLRTMHEACDLRGAEKQSGYAVTVTSLSVDDNAIATPLCIFMGVVAGGIKESYVLGSNSCPELKLPNNINVCTVKNVIKL